MPRDRGGSTGLPLTHQRARRFVSGPGEYLDVGFDGQHAVRVRQTQQRRWCLAEFHRPSLDAKQRIPLVRKGNRTGQLQSLEAVGKLVIVEHEERLDAAIVRPGGGCITADGPYGLARCRVAVLLDCEFRPIAGRWIRHVQTSLGKQVAGR